MSEIPAIDNTKISNMTTTIKSVAEYMVFFKPAAIKIPKPDTVNTSAEKKQNKIILTVTVSKCTDIALKPWMTNETKFIFDLPEYLLPLSMDKVINGNLDLIIEPE